MRKVITALTLAAAMSGSRVATAKTLKVGDVAPPFQVTLMDGTRIKSTELRGKVIILNFWATWCVPCKRELPLLDSYYRLRRDHGLRAFAVATEDSVPASRLKPLFAAMAIPAARRIDGPYGVIEALPTNFIIDRHGIIRYAQAAAFELDDLNAILVPLLREPEPPAP